MELYPTEGSGVGTLSHLPAPESLSWLGQLYPCGSGFPLEGQPQDALASHVDGSRVDADGLCVPKPSTPG